MEAPLADVCGQLENRRHRMDTLLEQLHAEKNKLLRHQTSLSTRISQFDSAPKPASEDVLEQRPVAPEGGADSLELGSLAERSILSVPEELLARPSCDGNIRLTWFYDEQLLEQLLLPDKQLRSLHFEVRQQSEGAGGRVRTRMHPCPVRLPEAGEDFAEQWHMVEGCVPGRNYRLSVRAVAVLNGVSSPVQSEFSETVVCSCDGQASAPSVESTPTSRSFGMSMIPMLSKEEGRKGSLRSEPEPERPAEHERSCKVEPPPLVEPEEGVASRQSEEPMDMLLRIREEAQRKLADIERAHEQLRHRDEALPDPTPAPVPAVAPLDTSAMAVALPTEARLEASHLESQGDDTKEVLPSPLEGSSGDQKAPQEQEQQEQQASIQAVVEDVQPEELLSQCAAPLQKEAAIVEPSAEEVQEQFEEHEKQPSAEEEHEILSPAETPAIPTAAEESNQECPQEEMQHSDECGESHSTGSQQDGTLEPELETTSNNSGPSEEAHLEAAAEKQQMHEDCSKTELISSDETGQTATVNALTPMEPPKAGSAEGSIMEEEVSTEPEAQKEKGKEQDDVAAKQQVHGGAGQEALARDGANMESTAETAPHCSELPQNPAKEEVAALGSVQSTAEGRTSQDDESWEKLQQQLHLHKQRQEECQQQMEAMQQQLQQLQERQMIQVQEQKELREKVAPPQTIPEVPRVELPLPDVGNPTAQVPEADVKGAETGVAHMMMRPIATALIVPQIVSDFTASMEADCKSAEDKHEPPLCATEPNPTRHSTVGDPLRNAARAQVRQPLGSQPLASQRVVMRPSLSASGTSTPKLSLPSSQKYVASRQVVGVHAKQYLPEQLQKEQLQQPRSQPAVPQYRQYATPIPGASYTPIKATPLSTTTDDKKKAVAGQAVVTTPVQSAKAVPPASTQAGAAPPQPEGIATAPPTATTEAPVTSAAPSDELMQTLPQQSMTATKSSVSEQQPQPQPNPQSQLPTAQSPAQQAQTQRQSLPSHIALYIPASAMLHTPTSAAGPQVQGAGMQRADSFSAAAVRASQHMSHTPQPQQSQASVAGLTDSAAALSLDVTLPPKEMYSRQSVPATATPLQSFAEAATVTATDLLTTLPQQPVNDLQPPSSQQQVPVPSSCSSALPSRSGSFVALGSHPRQRAQPIQPAAVQSQQSVARHPQSPGPPAHPAHAHAQGRKQQLPAPMGSAIQPSPQELPSNQPAAPPASRSAIQPSQQTHAGEQRARQTVPAKGPCSHTPHSPAPPAVQPLPSQATSPNGEVVVRIDAGPLNLGLSERTRGGLKVTSVSPGGSTDKASGGAVKEGMLLLDINGQPVFTMAEAAALLAARPVMLRFGLVSGAKPRGCPAPATPAPRRPAAPTPAAPPAPTPTASYPTPPGVGAAPAPVSSRQLPAWAQPPGAMQHPGMPPNPAKGMQDMRAGGMPLPPRGQSTSFDLNSPPRQGGAATPLAPSFPPEKFPRSSSMYSSMADMPLPPPPPPPAGAPLSWGGGPPADMPPPPRSAPAAESFGGADLYEAAMASSMTPWSSSMYMGNRGQPASSCSSAYAPRSSHANSDSRYVPSSAYMESGIAPPPEPAMRSGIDSAPPPRNAPGQFPSRSSMDQGSVPRSDSYFSKAMSFFGLGETQDAMGPPMRATQSNGMHSLKVWTSDSHWEVLSFATDDNLEQHGQGFLRRHGLKPVFQAGLVYKMRQMIAVGQSSAEVDIVDLI